MLKSNQLGVLGARCARKTTTFVEDIDASFWRRSRWALVAGLLAGLSFGGPAFGAGPEKDDREAQAMSHFDAATTAITGEQWGKAREELSLAWEAMPHYMIALTWGRVDMRVGSYRDAAKHLEACLRDGAQMSEDERSEVVAMLADVRAKLGKLRIRLDVVGADILVDGERVGTTPLEADVVVDPGQRKVVARKNGVRFVPVSLDVAPGAALTVPIEREPSPSPIQAVKKETDRGPGWRPWAIAGGATLAIGGVGTGIALMASGADDNTMTGAVGAFAVGGVATIGTFIVALVPTTKKPQKSGLWVAPTFGGPESGIRVGGAF